MEKTKKSRSTRTPEEQIARRKMTKKIANDKRPRTGNPAGAPKKGVKYEKTQRNSEKQQKVRESLALVRQESALRDLKKWLDNPMQRNRAIPISEASIAMNRKTQWFKKTIGLGTFGQVYLEMNPDCDQAVRVYYETLVGREVDRVTNNTTINLNLGENKTYQHKIDASTVRTRAHALDRIVSSRVTSLEKRSDIPTIDVGSLSENDKVIFKIHERYVAAPISEMPTIDGVMRDFGLLDRDGNPLTSLTETEVRNRALSENWRDERKASLHRRWDYVDDEVKMVTTVRNFEVQKIIFNTIKLVSRAITQYYTTGRVTSIQPDPVTGRPVVLDVVPDVTCIAALAEVMRRMTDSNKEVNIQINQFNNMSEDNSLFMKQYASKLAQLSQDQLNDEIEKISQIRSILNDSFQNGLLAEAIEAEVLRSD